MFKKIITTIALAAGISVANAPITASQELVQGYNIDSPAIIGTSWVTIKSTVMTLEPFENSRTISVVPRGTRLQVISPMRITASGVSIQVVYQDKVGWVWEGNLRPSNAVNKPRITEVNSGINLIITNVNNWASLRQSTSTQSQRLAKVPRGALVVTTGQIAETPGNSWQSVSYNGIHGWIPHKFLTQAANQPSLQPQTFTPTPPVGVQAGVSYTVTNVNSWASLRSSTSTKSQRIAKVPLGAPVVTTGQQAQGPGGLTWLSVSYSGLSGWMPRKYLAQQGSGTGANGNGLANPSGAYPVGNYSIINVNNWASLRSSASRSAGRLAKVPRGQSVYYNGVRDRVGGELWFNVQYGGLTGWMPEQYLGLQ